MLPENAAVSASSTQTQLQLTGSRGPPPVSLLQVSVHPVSTELQRETQTRDEQQTAGPQLRVRERNTSLPFPRITALSTDDRRVRRTGTNPKENQKDRWRETGLGQETPSRVPRPPGRRAAPSSVHYNRTNRILCLGVDVSANPTGCPHPVGNTPGPPGAAGLGRLLCLRQQPRPPLGGPSQGLRPLLVTAGRRGAHLSTAGGSPNSTV